MEYENKRKEEIIRAIQLWGHGDITRECLEYIFPELKESEDERIRKEIQRVIEQLDKDTTICGKKYDYNKWLSWLEKQGEMQSTITWHSASEVPDEKRELLCEWESDDAIWHDVAFYHHNTNDFRQYMKRIDNVTRWTYIDELFIKQVEKKPMWTEEDECYMGECISAIATKDGWSFEEKRKTKHWLKSIKKKIHLEAE